MTSYTPRIQTGFAPIDRGGRDVPVWVPIVARLRMDANARWLARNAPAGDPFHLSSYSRAVFVARFWQGFADRYGS